MKSFYNCVSVLLCLIVFFVSPVTFTQDDPLVNQSSFARFEGQLNLSSEFYNKSTGYNLLPSNTQRLIFRSVVTLYDQIQLPFEFYWTNQQAQFQQPFTQFGINPRITEWLQLHGGYFTAPISDFSFGDVRILGGGIELTPGLFRISALYGRSAAAQETDTIGFFSGRYKQTSYALKLGYGNLNTHFINLNLFHAVDDSTSIKRNSQTPNATENFVASIDFGVRPIEEVSLQFETAMSAFSNDIRSSTLKDADIPSFFFTQRNSSQIDGAAKVNIVINPGTVWGLNLGAKWIGPGFMTSGYAQLQNDLIEFTGSPRLSLLENKLNLRGTIGVRENNLRNTRRSTAARFTGSLIADYLHNNFFGINLQFNNNQIKTSNVNDSLNLSNIFNSFALSPRFFFSEFGGANNVIVSYSFQNSESRVPFRYNNILNTTNTLNIMHALSFPSSLIFTTSLFYNHIKAAGFLISMTTISETAGHRFLDNALNTSVTIGFSSTSAVSTSNIILLKISASYNLVTGGAVSLNVSNNKMNSSESFNPSYNELQGILQYDINF